MEILIPTHDNLVIAPDFEEATAFRHITVINGTIRHDCLQPDVTTGINGGGSPSDQVVIARDICADTERNLQQNHFAVVHTRETNIINALMDYLGHAARRESNYCCCP